MTILKIKMTDIFDGDNGVIRTDLTGMVIKTEIFISGTGRVNVDGVVTKMEIIDRCPGVNRLGKFIVRITMENGFTFDNPGELDITFMDRDSLVKFLTDSIEQVNEYLNSKSSVMHQEFISRNGVIEAKWKLDRLTKLLKVEASRV